MDNSGQDDDANYKARSPADDPNSIDTALDEPVKMGYWLGVMSSIKVASEPGADGNGQLAVGHQESEANDSLLFIMTPQYRTSGHEQKTFGLHDEAENILFKLQNKNYTGLLYSITNQSCVWLLYRTT